ncbi:regulatory protein IclR [Burkholderia sp. lig30]|jgi:hypothetical protein|uniref:helix-turn-helix domain-containing protein n=1 Tax=Burkholderia sp. lig30 TaxID=1192124 RepID=UPI000461BA41|nr:helix-turn-helix domain-containing protein [Burkholderia sp. lig30]KDB10281.1 regulatory protein IclR [Burkholderia sp. lig30]
MNEPQSGQAADAEFDPVVAVVLEQLWMASADGSGKPWTLAKLAKRAALPMSTLRRTLTMLKSAGLADFDIDEEGRGMATLTGPGRALCETVAGAGSGRAG